MGKKSSLAIPQQKLQKPNISPTCEEMIPSGNSPPKALIFYLKRMVWVKGILQLGSLLE